MKVGRGLLPVGLLGQITNPVGGLFSVNAGRGAAAEAIVGGLFLVNVGRGAATGLLEFLPDLEALGGAVDKVVVAGATEVQFQLARW